MRLSTIALISACAVGAFVACGSTSPRSSTPGPVASASAVATFVTSNVTRADYAGSEACKGCHAELFDAWQKAPMHRMTRAADHAEIRAPFDGRALRFKDDLATLETVDGARYVRLESTRTDGLYRVTKVIGGHHREDFAGVAVSAERSDATITDAREVILPVSYMIATGELRYKGYSVMATERPGLRVGPVWSQTCIFCHNTEPYLSTILGALAASTRAKKVRGYQGEVVDALLPFDRRQFFIVDDESALARTIALETSHLGATSVPTKPLAEALPEALAEAIDATRSRFDETQLVELGIGCEACHGGAREHVGDPKKHPSMSPKSPLLHVEGFGLHDGQAEKTSVNRACARCHQVLFSGYPSTWEGGARGHDPGGSTINSGEARDFLLGGCAAAMRCNDCHDPHAIDGSARTHEIESIRGNKLCARCHEAESKSLTAHTHHAETSEGSVCVRCHMPRKNVALDGTLGVYHRVGSPTDRARIEHDRPIECALCHADASVRTLTKSIEKWWSKRFDEASLVALYGDLDANVLRATVERGKPHEQAVAIFTLGAKRDRSAVAAIAAQTTNAIPLVRFYARDALSKIFGAPSPIDLNRENHVIREATDAWIRAHATP